jgi:hypothetical protein
MDECFVKGTKVLMSNYSYKNIEDIHKGDSVKNLNTFGNVLSVFKKGKDSVENSNSWVGVSFESFSFRKGVRSFFSIDIFGDN